MAINYAKIDSLRVVTLGSCFLQVLNVQNYMKYPHVCNISVIKDQLEKVQIIYFQTKSVHYSHCRGQANTWS